ncbi:MAG: dihydrolipoamide succinyltransferase, partial [Geminicoccaceae bacterium]|nr:dihydrolipoamide succinyltransferase [Geminicoccaceae bacterium]
MSVDIKVPTLGESVTEATIARWLKKPGDAVRVDEPLVELETDKVSLEVPSPVAGVLKAVSAEEGSDVEVGAVIGSIDEGAEAPAGSAAVDAPAEKAEAPGADEPADEPADRAPAKAGDGTGAGRPAQAGQGGIGPAARKLAE